MKNIKNKYIPKNIIKRPKLRRSTHEYCTKCLYSKEYYDDLKCTNCGYKFNKIINYFQKIKFKPN